MEHILEFITQNASKAHWFIFLSLLLAGCNIPISIDAVIILSAVIAASLLPQHTPILFASVLIGCICSAYIAFFIGKFMGEKLSKTKLFHKLLQPKQLEKMEGFYKKYGIWTFIIGRFIPFGIRNCIFMTSGMSKMPFKTFMLRDMVACSIWCTTMFTSFFFLGQNFDLIFQKMKTLNLILFTAFSMVVITFICYKLRKNKQANNRDTTI